jgi:hypothetical protein
VRRAGIPADIEEQTGRVASFGRLYATLERRERKGLSCVGRRHSLRRRAAEITVWFAKQVVVAVCAGVWSPVRDDKLTALRARCSLVGAQCRSGGNWRYGIEQAGSSLVEVPAFILEDHQRVVAMCQ